MFPGTKLQVYLFKFRLQRPLYNPIIMNSVKNQITIFMTEFNVTKILVKNVNRNIQCQNRNHECFIRRLCVQNYYLTQSKCLKLQSPTELCWDSTKYFDIAYGRCMNKCLYILLCGRHLIVN